MTVSRHEYSAVLIGAPDVPLSVRGGTITLDAGRAPHVQASLVVALPDTGTLASLDPRESPRVRVTADASFPGGGQTRTFDLGLRDRAVDHSGATVALDLASDEALLEDFAPLVDDTTPLNYQLSLRGLVGYVLNQVIPGAVLNTSLSAADTAVPALADSSNLIRNPRAGTNLTDWATTVTSGGLTPLRQTSGGPSYAPTYVAYLSNAGVFTNNAEIYIAESAVSISTGKRYVLSVGLSGTTGRQLILDAVCFDASGNILGFIPAVTTPMLAGGAWSRPVTAPFEAYPNTSKIRVRVRAASLGGSEYVNVTGWRLSEHTGDLAKDGIYFDGSTTDTAQYDYAWSDVAHASVSTRKTLVDAATPAALTWRAGQSALDFLAPIVQRAGLRLVCNEARVWTLRDEGYSAAGLQSIRYGVNLIAGSDTISRDSGLWYDGAVTVYTWTGPDGIQRRQVDAWALTGSPSRGMRIAKNTPSPGPGFSQYAVRRAQGRGREVTATTVADWTVAAEQPVAILLEGAPPQIGATQAVAFDLDRDEMTVRTRTTDTPLGAIDLLPGTIDALPGTIDSL